MVRVVVVLSTLLALACGEEDDRAESTDDATPLEPCVGQCDPASAGGASGGNGGASNGGSGGTPLPASGGDSGTVFTPPTIPDGCRFVCDDGEVTNVAWVCDGFDDCADGSDEASCTAQDMFRCGPRDFVPHSYVCDGEADCDDASDESDCPDAGPAGPACR